MTAGTHSETHAQRLVAHLVRCVLASACLLTSLSFAEELNVIRLDGTVVAGRVTGGGEELTLEQGGRKQRVEWIDVLLARPQRAPASRPASRPQLNGLMFELNDGSRVLATIASDDGRRISLELTQGGHGSIPVAAVRRVSVLGNESVDPTRPAASEPTESFDTVTVLGAKERLVLNGTLQGLEPTGIRFTYKERERTIPWSKIGVLTLARPPLQRSGFSVRLTDGQAFVGPALQASESGVTLRHEVFGELHAAWSDVEQIEQLTDQIVFLSALQPAQFSQETTLGKTWDYALDHTFSLQPIRLGGQTYARGVCLHARSRLTYALGGAAHQFSALVGILDEMGPRGCVNLRVLCDGKVCWEAEQVRGGDNPRAISIDLNRVQLLTLEVDYGDDLDLSGQVAWALARVLR